MRVLEGSLLTSATRISSAALSAVAGIITARVLGPDGKGQYTLIILLPTLLIYLGHLGLGASGVYFVGKRRYEGAEIAGSLGVCAVGIGAVLVLIALLGIYHLDLQFLKGVDKTHAVLGVLMTPVLLLNTYFMWVLLGDEKIKEYNLVDIVRPIILVVMLVLLIVILAGGVLGATVSYMVGIGCATLIGVYLVQRMVGIRWSWNWGLISGLSRFGLKNHLGGVAQFLNYRLGIVLVGHFLTVKAVGHYSVAIAVAETLWYIPTAVGLVLLPKISSLETTEANAVTPVFCRNVFFVTAGLGLLYALVAGALVPMVFGQTFAPSVRPLLLLLPGVALFSIFKVLSSDFIGRGRPILNTYAAVISLVVMVILSMTLIPKFGLMGAALASTASYCACCLVGLVTFWRVAGVGPVSVLRPRRSDWELYRRSLRRLAGRVNRGLS